MYLSIYLSIHPSVHLSIRPSIHIPSTKEPKKRTSHIPDLHESSSQHAALRYFVSRSPRNLFHALARGAGVALLVLRRSEPDERLEEKAEELGVTIFTADIIYHLFDQFTEYMEAIEAKKKAGVANEAVFPCRLKILKEFIICRRNPIILGVEVIDGIVLLGKELVYIYYTA